jgi:hypothetical protein
MLPELESVFRCSRPIGSFLETDLTPGERSQLTPTVSVSRQRVGVARLEFDEWRLMAGSCPSALQKNARFLVPFEGVFMFVRTSRKPVENNCARLLTHILFC